ncbi:unnamed protein product [Rhizophagus irregularis]|nr:unnamed protein product [Rhizophagus irregularis]
MKDFRKTHLNIVNFYIIKQARRGGDPHFNAKEVTPPVDKDLVGNNENNCNIPKVQPECYFSSDNVNNKRGTEINFEIEMKVKELNANDRVLRWQAITVSVQNKPNHFDLKTTLWRTSQTKIGKKQSWSYRIGTMSEISAKMKKADLEEMFYVCDENQ